MTSLLLPPRPASDHREGDASQARGGAGEAEVRTGRHPRSGEDGGDGSDRGADEARARLHTHGVPSLWPESRGPRGNADGSHQRGRASAEAGRAA